MLQYPHLVGVGALDDPLMLETATAAMQHRNDTVDWEIIMKKVLFVMARFKPGTAYQAMLLLTTLCNGFTPFVLLAYYFSK